MNTPLHLAVDGEHYDMVELLVFLGADVYAKNSRKKDPEENAYEVKN